MTSEMQATVAERIREFVCSRFPLARKLEFRDEDSLLDAGVIDSLGILDLVAFLEETFAVQASDEDLNPENFDSIATLVRFVESKR
ncbi:MAG: acyl carrier protein [Planctomycetota bacterium]